MAGVPNPFYSTPGFGQGVASIVQAFTPDPQSTLRTAAAAKTAYETREIRDRVVGREELGNTLAGFDPKDPAAASTLSRVIIDAYKRGLKPDETAKMVMSLMSNGGANEAAVTRALVGAGHAPNVNQGVTYADLQGRRSQIENEAARRTGITAGATIRAAQIAADERASRPQFGPGFMYKAGQGIVPNPHDPRRFQNVSPGATPFNTETGTYGPTAPDKLRNVAPGASLYDTEARIPIYTAPDRAREQGPTLGFGADKQILSAIDERFGVVRDPKDREKMGLKPGDRLPLEPGMEQRLKTRATELFMDASSPAYKNAGKALDMAAQEIVGDPANLEPGGAPPDERSVLGSIFNSPPAPQYRVLKKDAKPGQPGAANAMKNATAPGAAPAPAKGAEPLPYSPDGKVDPRRLKVGAEYDTPRGRLRWNGRTMDPVK